MLFFSKKMFFFSKVAYLEPATLFKNELPYIYFLGILDIF